MGRQSMPVRHNSRNWLRRSLYGLLIVFLAVLIAAVCIFSVVNANGLQTAVDRRTKAYVSDVTFQMAQNIDAQLANVMQTLEMLTDSLVRIDGAEHRMDFLKQRAQMLGFTQLVLCDVEGEGICTDASTHNFSGRASRLPRQGNAAFPFWKTSASFIPFPSSTREAFSAFWPESATKPTCRH